MKAYIIKHPCESVVNISAGIWYPSKPHIHIIHIFRQRMAIVRPLYPDAPCVRTYARFDWSHWTISPYGSANFHKSPTTKRLAPRVSWILSCLIRRSNIRCSRSTCYQIDHLVVVLLLERLVDVMNNNTASGSYLTKIKYQSLVSPCTMPA